MFFNYFNYILIPRTISNELFIKIDDAEAGIFVSLVNPDHTFPFERIFNGLDRVSDKLFFFCVGGNLTKYLINQLLHRFLNLLTSLDVYGPVDFLKATNFFHFCFFNLCDWFAKWSFDLADDSPVAMIRDYLSNFVETFIEVLFVS